MCDALLSTPWNAYSYTHHQVRRENWTPQIQKKQRRPVAVRLKAKGHTWLETVMISVELNMVVKTYLDIEEGYVDLRVDATEIGIRGDDALFEYHNCFDDTC